MKDAERVEVISLAIGAALLLIFLVGAIAFVGVPGLPGGTSPSQQHFSGKPQPRNDTLETQPGTTGYGNFR